MKEKGKIATYSPDVDDFASRYDRMVATGAGSRAVKVAVVVALLLAAVGLLGFLLG